MIKEFRGEYSWLSNFADVEIIFEGDSYRSVENAYMAAKSSDPAWRTFCQAQTAAACKKASKDIELRPDWEESKKLYMWAFLWQKFNKPSYKERLLATGDQNIIEGNFWNDKYWGICLKDFEGENWLGRLIMNIRLKIRKDENK